MLSFYEVCLAVGALWAKAGFLKSRVGAVVLSWADGPYHISDFPEGATVSHRFPVVQVQPMKFERLTISLFLDKTIPV